MQDDQRPLQEVLGVEVKVSGGTEELDERICREDVEERWKKESCQRKSFEGLAPSPSLSVNRMGWLLRQVKLEGRSSQVKEVETEYGLVNEISLTHLM